MGVHSFVQHTTIFNAMMKMVLAIWHCFQRYKWRHFLSSFLQAIFDHINLMFYLNCSKIHVTKFRGIWLEIISVEVQRWNPLVTPLLSSFSFRWHHVTDCTLVWLPHQVKVEAPCRMNKTSEHAQSDLTPPRSSHLQWELGNFFWALGLDCVVLSILWSLSWTASSFRQPTFCGSLGIIAGDYYRPPFEVVGR